MSDQSWRDSIAADRMRVDQAFADRVEASRFSRQEWSLVMTAVEFEVEGEGGSARLVADTSRIESVVPELERIRQQGGMGGGGAGAGGSGGGLFDSIASKLGLGSGADDETVEAASELADEYASALQERLEEQGKWERIRERATASASE